MSAECSSGLLPGNRRRLRPVNSPTPTGFTNVSFPACLGPLRYADRGPLERDIAHLSAAVEKAKPVEAFMTAPSPGILTRFVVDTYYRNEDAYLQALLTS